MTVSTTAVHLHAVVTESSVTLSSFFCHLTSPEMYRQVPALIPLDAKWRPSRSNPLSPGPSFHRPEESKNSSNSSREFSLPTILLGDLPFTYREILRDIANLCARSRAFKTPNPDGSKVNVLVPSGISLSGNRQYDVRFTYPKPESLNPNSDVHVRENLPCHVTSSLHSKSGIAGSRFSCSQFLGNRKSRMPNPDLPGSRATCPL
jgi:hypothetical protein